jgi:hypothetical protein
MRTCLSVLLLVPALVTAETKCGASDCKSKYGDGCPCCASYITSEEQCDLCRLNCSECAQVKTLPRQALAVTSTPQVFTRVVARALLPQPATCTADCNARQPTPDCPICCFVDKCKATYANCTKAARDACCQDYIGTGACKGCLSANGCVVVPTPAPPVPAPTPVLSPCGHVKPAQCKFWQDFFDTAGGYEWKICNELRDDPCECGGRTCGWQQPTCVSCQNGDITVLTFTDGLNGALPESIGALTSLTSLALYSLGSNYLNGTLPSSIGEMTSLKYLRLDDNQLTGTIPSTLAKLKQLTILNLCFNNLTGFVPSLPFEQYDDCQLSSTPAGTATANHFSCPLPANCSGKCRAQCK